MTTALMTTQNSVDNQNFFALAEKFLAYAQVSAASVKAYSKGIKRLREYFTAKSIAYPTREVILEYREHLKAHYAATTANLYLTAAKLFLSFLSTERILAKNPADRVKGLKVTGGHKKDALNADKVQAVLKNFDTSTLKGKRDKAMFGLMVTAGLRTVEVSRANVDDLVEREGKIFLLVQGKGRLEKDEAVRLSPGVYQLICDYLSARQVTAQSQPLFASTSRRNAGARISTCSISRLVKSFLCDAGINSRRLTAHSLRHTAATTALKAGATLREVQQVLRHSSIAITEIYLHELDRINNNAECLTAAAFGL